VTRGRALAGPSWFDQVNGYGARMVAEALGLTVDAPPRRGVRPCPGCGAEKRGSADRRAAAELTSDGGGWHCYRCQAKGDAVALLALATVGSATPGASAWPEVRRWAAARGFCDPDPRDSGSLPPRPRLRPPPPRPAEAPPPRPPAGEVLELWTRGLPVTADAEAAAWVASRGLNASEVEGRDLARALPVAGALPPWARYLGASWREAPARFRLLVPMYGAGGALESLHVRAFTPSDPKGRDKAASPAGFQVRGLVFADALARTMLGGGLLGDGQPVAELVQTAGVVIAEGEPDFLTWATWASDANEAAPAVLGVVAGSWSDELAARVPDGTPVAVRTHADEAGEKYADRICASVAGRCRVTRRARGGA
jgi:hypothetical protein